MDYRRTKYCPELIAQSLTKDERGVAIMCREMEIMRNQAYEEGVEIGFLSFL